MAVIIHKASVMLLTTYEPAKHLQPFIKQFMIIESESGMDSRVLPDTSLVLAFCFSGKIARYEQGEKNNLPAAAFSGIRKSMHHLNYAGASATLLVKFTEHGAAAFFRLPLHELFDQTIALDQLVPASGSATICEQLSEAASHTQRIAVAEQWLCTLLQERRYDALVQHAVSRIKASNGMIRIKDLSAALHISQDPFEKRFRQATGATPKTFAEIVRFRYIINRYPQTGSLTDLALTAGFFDQAHFIKKFRAFTGEAPQHFLSSTRYW